MEPAQSFKFKQSDIFTPDEVSELYKIFKVIDEGNRGLLGQKDIERF